MSVNCSFLQSREAFVVFLHLKPCGIRGAGPCQISYGAVNLNERTMLRQVRTKGLRSSQDTGWPKLWT